MSGRTKRNLYRIWQCVVILAAFAGALGMLYVENGASFQTPSASLQLVLWCFLAVLIVFPLNVIVHEGGHLLFGWLSGMKFASVTVGRVGLFRTGKKIRFSRRSGYAGATQMFPKNGSCVRGRALLFSLGGVVLNVIYGVVFLVLFFRAERFPALFFFELFAPINLMEALTALYPVELPSGKTDGAFALGILQGKPEEDVALRVLQAQGILYRGVFSDIPQDLLFQAPVVREDAAAFCALMQLRWQYLFWKGDREGVLREYSRLKALFCEQNINRAELACDLAYLSMTNGEKERAEGYFSEAAEASETCAYYRAASAFRELTARESEKAYRLAEKLPLKGMRELEKELLRRAKREE